MTHKKKFGSLPFLFSNLPRQPQAESLTEEEKASASRGAIVALILGAIYGPASIVLWGLSRIGLDTTGAVKVMDMILKLVKVEGVASVSMFSFVTLIVTGLELIGAIIVTVRQIQGAG